MSSSPVATVRPSSLQLAAAYGVCRHIARSAAKNFYYGFLVLPKRKRNALCAAYAFMRRADDIADEPGMSLRERRRKLDELKDSLHRAAAGEPTDDPVLMALCHTQTQYGISTELLDQLVEGAAMDIGGEQGDPRNPTVAYPTFTDLYRYCFHVASVVGLVCIRIFGYSKPEAEPLAERLGVAFQLTNILRDVDEDAKMGRVYIPGEDLDRFGVTPQELAAGRDEAKLKPLLEAQAKRAFDFYRAADELLPLVEEVSQPALWVLASIYRRLLEKIRERDYDVYTERVRLTIWEKLGLLARGFLKRLA